MTTGKEFHEALKKAKVTQAEFAREMGVQRSTIVDLCARSEIKPFWAHALAGLVAKRTAKMLLEISELSKRKENQ